MKKSLVVFIALFSFCVVGFAQVADDGLPVDPSDVSTVATNNARAQGSITTLFAANNGYAGNTFDIMPTVNMFCDGIDVNAGSGGESTVVDVYYKLGSCVGFENDASAWTFLGTNTATSAGYDLPTWIDLSGNGVQFVAGDTYGIYVDIANYSSSRMNYTNGQHTYSNTEISLTSNTGQTSPAFSGSFFPREWNGTFYYNDSGVANPIIDVKCNGGDGPVNVYQGVNCTITIDVQARDFVGFPVDVWIAIKAPSGSWWTWRFGNWYNDLGHCAWSSGLLDWSGTVLDIPLPLGSYKAYIALETNVNGSLDLGAIYDMDVVDFDVVVQPTEYKWDSGTTDNLLCWTSGGDMVGMHCFDTIPGGENLTNVGTIFGSVLYSNYAPGNGTPTDFYVWEATSFGDPTNASLLTQGTGVVGNVDTDIHYWDACPCTVTTPNFYVAYNLHHAGYEYCLAIDGSVTYVPGAAFYTGTNTLNAFDPANLYANQYPPTESPYGFWTVRAEY